MLLDLSMPGDAFEAMRAIVDSSSDTGIVVFTAYAEVDLARRALAAGARGFVLKGRPVEDLHAAIAAARDGELYISPEFAEKLAHSDPESSKARRGVALSPREEQLLSCLFEAMSNKEIARKLNLSEKTVKHYMTNLMGKLNARNRLEVVIAARELRGALGAPANIPDVTARAD